MPPHLRPVDTGEIMDGAFQLYRRHFRAFLAAGALSFAPMPALWAWGVWQSWRGAPLDAEEHTADELPFAVSALLGQAMDIASLPLVAIARTLRFNDLRVRVAALDVRLVAERLAPAAA